MNAERIRRIVEHEKLKCSFVTETFGHPDGRVIDCTEEICNALLAYVAMSERCEELEAQCLKICGRDTCDHKGTQCMCCARDVLDFVLHGFMKEGG